MLLLCLIYMFSATELRDKVNYYNKHRKSLNNLSDPRQPSEKRQKGREYEESHFEEHGKSKTFGIENTSYQKYRIFAKKGGEIKRTK